MQGAYFFSSSCNGDVRVNPNVLLKFQMLEAEHDSKDESKNFNR